MFWRDPNLPLHHLLGGPSAEEDGQLDEYVAKHQQRITDAFRMATIYNEKEALMRKTQNDKSANATNLPIGFRIFVRNVQIRGRNKMQDRWEEKLYQEADRPDPEGNVYVITPLHAVGPLITLHRDALRDAREIVPEMEADREQKYCHIPTDMPTSSALYVDQEVEDLDIGQMNGPLPVDCDEVIAAAQGQDVRRWRGVYRVSRKVVTFNSTGIRMSLH